MQIANLKFAFCNLQFFFNSLRQRKERFRWFGFNKRGTENV